MSLSWRAPVALAVIAVLGGCASPSYPPRPVEPPAAARPAAHRPVALAEAPAATKTLKRKIAIGRFSNETRYGRTFVRSESGDPLGKQVSDMLGSRLVESGAFMVFERPDLDKVTAEQKIGGGGEVVGVDTLILGSITEFGRSTVSRSGFIGSTKLQKVEAKVEIRLADPRTGHVFFSGSGRGEATAEAGEVFGFGSAADYDSTLNDKAIGAAISDVMNTLVTRLAERPWRSDVLKVEGGRVYVSGGARQGLRTGDILAVMRPGERVKSGQSGAMIALPATEIAAIRVVAQFGDSDLDEGSVAEIVSGSLDGQTAAELFVAERRK